MSISLETTLAAVFTTMPERPAFEYAGDRYHRCDIHRIAAQVCALLAGCGVPSEHPVMLAPRTRPAAVAALLGLVAEGRRIRMAYAFQSAARLLNEIDARPVAALIACAEDFTVDLIAGLAARGIAGIALDANSARVVAGLEDSSAACGQGIPARHIETLTSGTTGQPKAFLLPFDTIAEHFVRKSAMLGGSVAAAPSDTPIFLSVPLANISGLYGIFPTWVGGHPVVLADRFTIGEWHDYVRRYRPKFVNIPASIVTQVLDADIPREDLAGVEAVTTGAAPLDREAHRAFEAKYAIPILLGYGATEFAGSVAQMTLALHREWGERKFGSAGRAAPGAELRIVDPDSNAILQPGCEGLLEARTDRFSTGWIRTSDLAVIDEDGFLFHRGRADCAIVRGGFKILPETIENALMLHPRISGAIAAGISDRRLGQVPGVLLQSAPGEAAPTVAELKTHLRRHLLATQIPVYWCFVDTLPMTPSSKFDRHAAQLALEAEIDPSRQAQDG